MKDAIPEKELNCFNEMKKIIGKEERK